jgi:hypothetical protein
VTAFAVFLLSFFLQHVVRRFLGLDAVLRPSIWIFKKFALPDEEGQALGFFACP